jgi:hypothetical protein
MESCLYPLIEFDSGVSCLIDPFFGAYFIYSSLLQGIHNGFKSVGTCISQE